MCGEDYLKVSMIIVYDDNECSYQRGVHALGTKSDGFNSIDDAISPLVVARPLEVNHVTTTISNVGEFSVPIVPDISLVQKKFVPRTNISQRYVDHTALQTCRDVLKIVVFDM